MINSSDALFAAVLLCSAAGVVQAADHRVKMLNTGKDGAMVFEPDFVMAKVGDTVTFVPSGKSVHYSVSLLLPAGAEPWNGVPYTTLQVKLGKEGVYLYACEPHKTMGMVGVIQAGKALNLAQAKAAAAKEQAGFTMGRDRFDKALAQVK